MRKFQKKILLKLVQNLYMIHNSLKKKTGLIDDQGVIEILTEAQSIAIDIGTSIEELEGQGLKVVTVLEKYCDLVYQISIELKKWRVDTVYQELNKLIKKVEDEIKDKIDINYEIVFLPYQISMWDSFESIWLAAKEDPKCTCHVIPIPYYEKRSDQSLGTFKYDGKKYSNYVPIESWDQVDLRQLRPDVIYIHNPYDQFNLVTSIHPMFYSDKLKHYTDKLVYLPYFTSGGAMAEIFYELPLYYHVDNIIVQNEEMKKYFSEKIAHKLLALGSPKFDKIINYKPGKKEIPSEWLGKLKGKVFFYNISISSLLKYKEIIFEKFDQVLNLIEETGSSLIFRPHPLLETSIQSKLPTCLKKYQQIIERIKESKNLVLDTRPTADLSIYLSDAYIGEESSAIIHSFGVEGKPVLLINFFGNMEEKEDDKGQEPIFQRQGKNIPWAAREKHKESIGLFIDYVKKDQHNSQLQKDNYARVANNMDGSSGVKIHDYMMKELVNV